MDRLKMYSHRDFVRQVKRLGEEAMWTADDTKRAAISSMVPCAISISSFLSASSDQSVMGWKATPKPNWAPDDPRFYGLMDIATMAPLGYAAYRIYKYGGGFDYSDTTAALGLYGVSLLFSLFTLPFTKSRNRSSLFTNTFVMHITALGATYMFRKIDDRAGLLILPYAAWTGFYTLLAYAMK